MAKPTKKHGQAIKKLIKYIHTIIKNKLRYGLKGVYFYNYLNIFTNAD